jgi:hypothetical protein
VSDAFDPRQNLEAGIRHLRRLLDRYELPLALAAYNAGEGAVVRHGGVPPYPETRAYVARVLARGGLGSSAGSQTQPVGVARAVRPFGVRQTIVDVGPGAAFPANRRRPQS